jgi:hypothetical protein
MTHVVRFLHLNRVPIAPGLQQRIQAWAGFKFVRDRSQDEQVKEVMAMLSKVNYPLDRASLAATLLQRLSLTCYNKDQVVASHSEVE